MGPLRLMLGSRYLQVKLQQSRCVSRDWARALGGWATAGLIDASTGLSGHLQVTGHQHARKRALWPQLALRRQGRVAEKPACDGCFLTYRGHSQNS
jgi:hypothetical protein